jgi:HK97 family phage major capsid protein
MSKIAILAYRAKEHKKALDLLTKRAEEIQAEMDEINATVEADVEGDELSPEEVDNLEAKADSLDKELEEKNAEIGELNDKIAELESKIEEANKKNEEDKRSQQKEEVKPEIKKVEEVRMNRFKFFDGMSRDAVVEITKREEVKGFLERTRGLMMEKRAVSGADLTIPVVMLDLLRDRINKYSKLLSKVNVRSVSGVARQNILGAIPEGIWTEACGKLNELSISFNQVQVDGYKVGGFFAVCNATLKDSDENLADEIMYALGQAIGLALDKAILYGTGTKMPVGIVTRLAEVSEPSYYGDNEKTWTDLHSKNLLLIDANATTPEAFYADLITKLGVVESKYSDGNLFFAMSSKTYRALQAKMLNINAAGAIVSGQTKTMPIIGGDVVELDFIPDNVIIGGYGALYLLAEREGVTLAQSEHYKFVEDNTVFKGIARYDGRPVFGEAFVALNISQSVGAAAPVANAVSFAADSANP